MASPLYDSGWVPVASGTISTVIDLGEYTSAHVIFGASGSQAATGASITRVIGTTSPVPYQSKRPAYQCAPLLTGTYTVSNPTANTFTEYFFGGSKTGSLQLDAFVPTALGLTLTAGAGSWARIIVEAR